MTPIVFGFLSEAKEALAEFANGCLLIAGGFLVGYLLGGVIGWALGKWAFRQEKPESITRIGRPVGGIVLALIVAVIVFTGKGKSQGDGGEGKGATSTEPDGSKGSPPKVDPKIDHTPELKKQPEAKPADVTLRVMVYGGTAVVGDRAYQFEDERNLITFDQLKKAITERKASSKGKVTVAIFYPDDKNLTPGSPTPEQLHPDVAKVVRWARSEAKLGVELPPEK